MENIIFGILLHVVATIIDNSVMMCDEIIEVETKLYVKKRKTNTKNFNEKNSTCKTQNFYILLAFLLVTTALLMAV